MLLCSLSQLRDKARANAPIGSASAGAPLHPELVYEANRSRMGESLVTDFQNTLPPRNVPKALKYRHFSYTETNRSVNVKYVRIFCNEEKGREIKAGPWQDLVLRLR